MSVVLLRLTDIRLVVFLQMRFSAGVCAVAYDIALTLFNCSEHMVDKECAFTDNA